MPTKLTVRDYLMKMGAIAGIAVQKVKEQINHLGEEFYISEMLDIPMQSMSKGTLQKVGVISDIMERPDVLLLDEPLSGQDIEYVLMRVMLRG